ncbi:MAG: hypothetical protein HUK26_02640, partial [Duodenibacillus sp.]|nr:hypothetical protein [Duodenibacillus sp.]
MPTVDIFELSRSRRAIEGDFGIDDMPGLASLLAGEERAAQVHYAAAGTAGRKGVPGAELRLKGSLTTACAHCGGPLVIEIDKALPFLFTRTEAEADAMPIDADGEFV